MPKRILDIVVSALLLIFLMPLFVIIAIIIKLDSRGPILFSQKRIGVGFKPFTIYKFRTMYSGATQDQQVTAENDTRITKIGGLLRKFKLDELPQLINVLKGDMALVGPRPEVPKYVEIYKDEYKKILKLKPGLLDYATIDFRDEEKMLSKYKDPEEAYIKYILPIKMELYKRDIEKRTFYQDLKLILRNVYNIIKYR
ncbi:sugar transferase [Candidatus Omnitrophota bacterium]